MIYSVGFHVRHHHHHHPILRRFSMWVVSGHSLSSHNHNVYCLRTEFDLRSSKHRRWRNILTTLRPHTTRTAPATEEVFPVFGWWRWGRAQTPFFTSISAIRHLHFIVSSKHTTTTKLDTRIESIENDNARRRRIAAAHLLVNANAILYNDRTMKISKSQH